MNLHENVKEAYRLIIEANQKMMEIWLDEVLWTWQWWVVLLLAIVPWIVFFIFRKKESTSRLLFAGFFVILIASWFDFLGVLMGSWYYVHELVPFIPAFLPWDFSLLPVSIMMSIQFKPHIHPFLKAIIFSALTSFVGEPIFEWLDLYEPVYWKHYYSYPIMIGIFLVAHYLSTRRSFAKI